MKRETYGVQFSFGPNGYYRIRGGKPCCRAKNRMELACTRTTNHKGQHRADDVTAVRPWGRNRK